ncbi:thiol:disulfide interchange protein [Sphingomonas parva]|uniref:Thiol:disulfide interchange protein n=1 Tax=Sphingomonas parva TaxID=2555898 RepID=A0A4Y8ZV25_9SPHN|nr:thiol:disulfide interchange protein [Sphingomonas parva]
MPRQIWAPIALLGAVGAGALSLAPATAPAEPLGASRHIEARLESETATPAPGQRVRLAFMLRAEPGWHGYWLNPGESGAPPSVGWNLPQGVSGGDLRHPAPETLTLGGLVSYVHEGSYALMSELRVPRDAQPGTALPVTATLNLLACSDQACVPETKTLNLELTISDGKVPPPTRRRFDSLSARIPRPIAEEAEARVADGQLFVSLKPPRGIDPTTVRLYALSNDHFEPSATQTARVEDGQLVIRVPTRLKDPPASLKAVLSSGASSFAVSARPGSSRARAGAESLPGGPAPFAAVADPAAADAPPSGRPAAASPDRRRVAPVSSAEGPASPTLLMAFLGALLGGLILNLMPCVFPILSLKALSMVRSGRTESAARTEALAYGAGAVLVCLALGAGLIALRAAGSQVGWAFQLQDPRVILVLVLLTFAIGLNLAGMFELRSFGFGERLAGRNGAGGAFWTGALAAFVATPCTGPFMGAALGAALMLPAAGAMLVFAGLGIGLALPFLLVGFVPAARRRLPKPGAWMNTFRRILALPMFLTALALAWVLGRQSGVEGMTVGLAATLLLTLGLWWLGHRQTLGVRRSWAPALPLMLAAFAAILVVPADPPARASSGSREIGLKEPFSPARLAELRARRVPVFVDFTADWCLSCKVNERLAIDTERVRGAFQQAGVVILVGDWTNGDPAITRFLAEHGRNGIPYYLFFAPGEPGKELPQILTPSLLEEAARRAGGADS